MKKRFFVRKMLVALVVISMLLTSASFVFAQDDELISISIFHTNDIHSRVEETDSSIGYAKLASLVAEHREKKQNVLLLDAGDTLHGENIANLVEGESIVSIMNSVGYDAMTSGNHDFNYGQNRLIELSDMADYPILGANALKEDGGSLLQEYEIFELEGVKVGVLGLISPETAFKTHPNNVVGINFEDPILVAKSLVDQIRQEVDILIVLGHLGDEGEDTSIKLAEAIGQIDLIIDGHSHSTYQEGRLVNDVLIASTGEHFKNIGLVEIQLKDGEIVDKQARLISKEETMDIEDSEEVLQIINDINKAQEGILAQVIGETKVALDGERENVRTKETNLGNLVMDAFLEETGADIAMANGGGIRTSLEAGELTKGDVISVVPFSNFVITKKLTGSRIKEALEFSVRLYPESNGGFLQVAGLSFNFDPSQAEGQRVFDIKVGDQPLNLDEEYIVATHDFLAAGGDGYEMFADTEIVNEYPVMNEVVMNYIKKKEIVSPELEGRILVGEIEETPELIEEELIEEEVIVEETIEKVEEPQVVVYIVKSGDWLSTIAIKYDTSWEHLQELNGIKNPDLIFPGQEILIK